LNKIFAITPVNQDPFMITWDLGRRCNYDCSYCPSHRHDNFSSHASLDELKNTTDFLFEYISVIAEHRINKDFNVSFTGGEPTVNPNFIEFAQHIKLEYEKNYKDKFNLKLDLTTNGAMSEKMAAAVVKIFDYVTVSYHAEAVAKLKSQVTERIKQFKNSDIKLKVNVMFHAQHFSECAALCETLKELEIKFIPRLIGDDPDSKSSQAHLYTDEQKQWLTDFWGIDFNPTGRPCCGGRTFGVCSSEGTEQTKYVNYREFKNWYCSVNWYFLHIEQQTNLIYHHQTCQARLDGTRGSIGTIGDWKIVVDDLRNNIAQKTLPVIVCPNKLCGCGLCTPKSENRHNLLEVMPAVIKDTAIFNVD
jgi:MoaA/NifB/PqqE/SkfB family radical SAM enzyme